ncbi:hypothetical protein SGRA_3806 [Saprospira grandis str. Lewin]|uniref:Uncharacterized protein n=1 Tax=Saprospira grandis (strain Lewin) TaxID=984262 RepID=H6L5W2_SAPGL|nr:hypothetical protein SGRA_3806 [Saprospira grandis str. Lewin]
MQKISFIYLGAISLLALYCILSCKKKYPKDRFYLKKVTIRVVDYLGKDSMGCAIIDSYLNERKNDSCGIAVRFYKRFYSDSTNGTYIVIGYQSKGFYGTEEKIHKISLQTLFDQNSIDSFLVGNENFSFVNIEKAVNTSHTIESYPCGTNSCSCLGTEVFSSLTDFKRNYNSNSKKTWKGLLGSEVYFWMPKAEFKKLLADTHSTKIELRIEMEDGRALGANTEVKN